MELIVVRHGQTVDNARQVIQGQQPGELDEVGLEQAETLARELSVHEPDAIISSDLNRCLQTARQITHLLPNVPFSIDRSIRERGFGIYENLPSKVMPWATYQGPSNYGVRIPGGESFHDVGNRILHFLNMTYEDHTGSKVIAVTHGGPMRVIKAIIEKVPLSELTPHRIPNCASWKFTMHSTVEIDEVIWT